MSIVATRLVDGDAVHQAEVDDVDPQLGVDDVAHGLLEVVQRRRVPPAGAAAAPASPRRRGRRPRPTPVRVPRSCASLAVLPDAVTSDPLRPGPPAVKLRTTASLNAIQPSSAHFTRAG